MLITAKRDGCLRFAALHVVGPVAAELGSRANSRLRRPLFYLLSEFSTAVVRVRQRVTEEHRMNQICPKCRKTGFSSSIDDLCADVHWRCEECSYAAEENQSMAAPCGRCGEQSCVLGDADSTFRHCFYCHKTNRLFGPSLMDRLGWYVRAGSEKFGPFSRIELRSKIQDGEIEATDLVYDPWGEAVEASEVVKLRG